MASQSGEIADHGEGEDGAFAPLLARLGKQSRGAAWLCVNQLANIDLVVIEV